MASRTGPAMPAQKKIATYGKSSRKRNIRDTIPLRTAEPHASSSADGPAGGDIEDIARPSNTRMPTDSSTSLSNARNPGNHPNRSEITKLPHRESQDDVNLKKRKRPQTTPPAAIHRNPLAPGSSSLLKPAIPSRSKPAGPAKPKSATALASPRRVVVAQNTPRDDAGLSQPSEHNAAGTPNTKARSSGINPKMKSSQELGLNLGSRRPRLIDALAAQRPKSPESDSSMEEDEMAQSSLLSGPTTPSQQAPTLTREDSNTRPRARPGVVLQGKRVKYTYGQTRSILNDSQKTTDSGAASCEDDLDALLATPPELSQPDPFSFGDDDDVDVDGDVRPAIKSVHELRRAGANNRFADEMEDLLARIGTPDNGPSSMRRNALLELAQKLQHKDFISQFRDHATRDKVAVNIGKESDVISGFALTSILVTFLNFNPAAHLLRQLSDDGLGKLVGRLLRISEDVDELASQKRMKLSGASKRSIGEVKAHMIRMHIWPGRQPERISPQTIALLLLNVLCRVDPGYSAGVVKDAKNDLITIMDDYINSIPSDDLGFSLIISILESQSTLTLEDGGEVSWILYQTPKVARFLSNALNHWSDRPTDTQSTIIKLAINTSNTTQGAAGLNDEGLLLRLSSQICAGFTSAQDAVSNQRLHGEAYDGLLLILGVMINILEHCPSARENVGAEAVENLMALYLQNKASTSEADSVEKSQLSVAVGYLAVLLGYLSVVGSVRRRLAERTGGEGVLGLIGSIQEFIRMYRSVDSKVHELEGLVNDLQQLRRMPG